MGRQTSIAIAACLIGCRVFAQDNVTTIRVSPEVKRAAAELEPLGVNNFGDVGGTKHSNGNLITQSGFEPITMRTLHRVISAGEDRGKHWVTLDGPGTGNWLLFTDGTFSGAEMRAYRFVDGEGKPLDYLEKGWAAGGKLLDLTRGEEMVRLFTSRVLPKGTPGFPAGGWTAPGMTDTWKGWADMSKEKKVAIQESWRVYYESSVPLRMDDLVMFSRSFLWPDPEDFHPRTRVKGVSSSWMQVVGKTKHVPATKEAPAGVDFGKGTLEMTPADGVAHVWFKLFGATGRSDSGWYGKFDEGVTYRYETWVKELGTGGILKLGFGENQSHGLDGGHFGNTSLNREFQAPGEWTRIGYTFTAPSTPAEGGIVGAIIRYEGAGKLLVDNVKLQPVYEDGDADRPFVIYQPLFRTLMDCQPPVGHKGACRVWPGLSSDPMAQLLDWHPGSDLRLTDSIGVNPNGRTSIPKSLLILEATGDAPETRMVPWIITQVTHDEEEHRQLVEYLAAPYDPAIDTPENKPFAYRRVQQRGNNVPWTDTFREVIIEFGNENWHNRANANWIGVGRSGNVHGGGPEFGLFNKYMIGQMQKSPYWNDTLTVCIGGNYSAGVNDDGSVSGFGQEATVKAGGINNYHSHATYIGPRWETGESSQSTIDDAGVQKTLFAYRPVKEGEWAKQQATHERLHELGFGVRMSAYEGGPSGFGLRAKTKAEDRAGEYYGKSYAMGTAVLDSWLDAWAKGWTHQCYLNFGQGKWWNSHTSMSQGHRPSPGWLTQVMINRTVANMDMVTAEVANSPVYPVPTPQKGKKYKPGEVPTTDTATIHAHAFKREGRLAVAVVNLHRDNPQAVEIKLPIKNAKTITRHHLQGGPRDSNMDEMAVTLAQTEVDPTLLNEGILQQQIPAGSGVVFVFERR